MREVESKVAGPAAYLPVCMEDRGRQRQLPDFEHAGTLFTSKTRPSVSLSIEAASPPPHRCTVMSLGGSEVPFLPKVHLEQTQPCHIHLGSGTITSQLVFLLIYRPGGLCLCPADRPRRLSFSKSQSEFGVHS